jgi:hypothetical protein
MESSSSPHRPAPVPVRARMLYPRPPGGWPEQGSGPTSWVPAESAPAEATNDSNHVFPRP